MADLTRSLSSRLRSERRASRLGTLVYSLCRYAMLRTLLCRHSKVPEPPGVRGRLTHSPPGPSPLATLSHSPSPCVSFPLSIPHSNSLSFILHPSLVLSNCELASAHFASFTFLRATGSNAPMLICAPRRTGDDQLSLHLDYACAVIVNAGGPVLRVCVVRKQLFS